MSEGLREVILILLKTDPLFCGGGLPHEADLPIFPPSFLFHLKPDLFQFNGWSSTGPLNKPQPDGILKADGFGEQACTALLDDFFGDGLRWHDTKCNDRRHIVCEDLPVGNINFVRQQNPGVNIP